MLLTGATGFLGVHILDSLMKNETGNIYCLVRDISRLSKMLDYYFGSEYDNEIGKRIIPVKGDITDSNLSDILPADVLTVIHAAAVVKHFGNQEYFNAVNVGGTRNLLNYAEKVNASFIHISTVSVGGVALLEKGDKTVVFDESRLYIGQNLSNVYLKNKFEAEKLVLEEKLNGMDCKIMRVGNLTDRYSDMKFQPNYAENAFLKRMKAFIDLKEYPKEISEYPVEFSLVDITVEAIVKIAQNAGKDYTVFHVNNNKCMSISQMADMLKKSGYEMKAAAMSDFINHLTTEDAFWNCQ